MTKWTLPEGRKPLTDADMADLTRRLSDIDELYQAAKRDAEEAEAYAAELETKLAKALEALHPFSEMHLMDDAAPDESVCVISAATVKRARTTLAELEGEKP